MKILIDPIHTNDPQFCSMNFKLQGIMRYMLELREDVFFHYLIPKEIPGYGIWEVDHDWLIQDPRVQYHELPTANDRMDEYVTVRPELARLLDFMGPLWDVDMLVTSRTGMVPVMKGLMHKIASNTKYGLRRVVTIDDMPLLSFKKCVALKMPEIQSLQTLSGYLAADANYLMSSWEKKAAVKLAKSFLAPAQVRQLDKKIHDFSPVKTGKMGLKTKATITALYEGKRPFTVGYTQRWEKIHRGSADIIDLMEKHWIYRGEKTKMRFVITSNSQGFPSHDWLEVSRLPREEFWRVMREEVDVIICLTIDDNYSLALIEPVTLGTPAIILDAPYVRPTFGNDYPFLVKNATEAYAMVKLFIDDYAGMYAKFAKWSKETFQPIMAARNDVWLPEVFQSEVAQHEADLKAFASKEDNSITTSLLQDMGNDIHLQDELSRAYTDGRIGVNIVGLKESKTRRIRQSFNYLEWYRWKADLLASHGYRDASIAPGHLWRPEQ